MEGLFGLMDIKYFFDHLAFKKYYWTLNFTLEFDDPLGWFLTWDGFSEWDIKINPSNVIAVYRLKL